MVLGEPSTASTVLCINHARGACPGQRDCCYHGGGARLMRRAQQ